MRCYYVLIHGRLDWHGVASRADEGVSQPIGFFCHRYILAANEQNAKDMAFQRVRENLNDWAGQGGPKLDLEAEEVSQAPIHKLLIPEDRGHVFYDQE